MVPVIGCVDNRHSTRIEEVENGLRKLARKIQMLHDLQTDDYGEWPYEAARSS